MLILRDLLLLALSQARIDKKSQVAEVHHESFNLSSGLKVPLSRTRCGQYIAKIFVNSYPISCIFDTGSTNVWMILDRALAHIPDHSPGLPSSGLKITSSNELKVKFGTGLISGVEGKANISLPLDIMNSINDETCSRTRRIIASLCENGSIIQHAAISDADAHARLTSDDYKICEGNPALTVNDVDVWFGEKVEGNIFSRCPEFSCILGLGFDSLNAIRRKQSESVATRLLRSVPWGARSYSFNLVRNSESIIFVQRHAGLPDIDEDYACLPLVESAYWTVGMSGYRFISGDKKIFQRVAYKDPGASNRFVFDSGTTFLAIPSKDFMQVCDRLSGQVIDGKCYIPFDSPPVGFQVDLINRNQSISTLTLSDSKLVKKVSSQWRLVQIMPLDVPVPRGPALVAGTVVLRPFHTIFSREPCTDDKSQTPSIRITKVSSSHINFLSEPN